MAAVTASPPRLQKLPYHAWPTRFEKEQQAAGKNLGKQANDLASIGPWILGDMIGKGSSGRVKLGKHKYSGKIAAIKIISKNAALTSKTTINGMDAKHQKALQGIHREIVIMKLINHPCIMALYDLQETENEFYLALEYVEGGELFDYLVSRGRLAEPEALNYFKQILFGLDYCHRFNISHRDLKPENILLDKNMNIKIADFGMAALEVANGMLETSCGSPHYASPEIVAGKAYHGASSDIWSCGVVLYALLTGRLPFDHPNIRTLLQKVKAGKFRMHECLSPCAQDLIGRMLVVDPEERITIPQIFKHPFFLGPTNTIFINPAPPTLEDLSQPIGPYERVESAYLDNLLILFHTSRAELEKALRVRDAPNWEKAFLYLLRMYAERVRENYGEEDDEESVSETRRVGEVRREVFGDLTYSNGAAVGRGTTAGGAIKLSLPPPGRKRSSTVSGPAKTQPTTTAGSKVQFATPMVPVRAASTAGAGSKLHVARTAPDAHAREGNRASGHSREETRSSSHSREESRMSRHSREETRSSGHSREDTRTSRHSREDARSSGHSREESGRRTRPPSVMGPRPNPPSPSRIGRPTTSLVVPGGSRPSSPLAIEDPSRPIGSVLGGPAVFVNRAASPPPRVGSPHIQSVLLPSQNQAALGSPQMESLFEDAGLGSPLAPFRSILSPDLEGRFMVDYGMTPKHWSEDGGSRISEDAGAARRTESEIARRSTLSPHAEPFILGSLGQPTTKPVRKGKPSPLHLTNPNWQPVSSQPGTPVLESPRLGQQPKVTGWFTNLFTFRPVYHVLYSTVSIDVTRRECTRVLDGFGIQVLRADGQDMLRCNVDKFIDLEGVLITKPVRFRVEIRTVSRIMEGSPLLDVPLRSPALEVPSTPMTPSLSPSPYSSMLVITQEKGAHSTLKAIYARLRASWKLDALVSPALPMSAELQTPTLR